MCKISCFVFGCWETTGNACFDVFRRSEAENQRWLLNGNDELREIWEESEPVEEEEEFGRG